MEPTKSGWVAELTGLLGRLFSSEKTGGAAVAEGPAPGAAAEGRAHATALSGEALDTLRFLVKVGQVDGRFDAVERAFVLESMREAGQPATEADLDRIQNETCFKNAGDLVSPFREKPLEFRERLLQTGALLAAASGRVATDELKALRDASRALELPRETLDRLVNEAVRARGG